MGRARDNLMTVGETSIGTMGCLQVYDPSTDAWETMTGFDTVANVRYCAAAAVVDGGFLVMGGDNGRHGDLRSMVRYDIASDTWGEPEALPHMGGAPNSDSRYWTNSEPAPRTGPSAFIGRVEGPARSLHIGNLRVPFHSEDAGGSWTTLVTMKLNQACTPIFAFDGEGACARFSFENLPCDGPATLAIATLG